MNPFILVQQEVVDEQPANLTELFYIKHRFVSLIGTVTPEKAAGFVAMLMNLDARDPKKPIQIILNSFDSDNRSILMLYDVIRNLEAPVHTTCAGECSGAALLLLAAGAKRYGMKNSTFEVSQLTHDYGTYSNLANVLSLQDNFKKDNAAFMAALTSHTSKKVGDILKSKERHFCDAEEAVKLKIIDTVVEFDAKKTESLKKAPDAKSSKKSKKPVAEQKLKVQKAKTPTSKTSTPAAPTKKSKK